MKASDRILVYALGGIALIAAFWILLLGPKRSEVSELSDRVTELESSVAQQEQAADYAVQAKQGFDTNYRRLVVLGKAVPEDADSPSLVTELDRLAARSGIEFRALELVPGSGVAPAEAPAAAESQTDQNAAAATTPAGETGTPTGEQTEEKRGEVASEPTPATPPPATEALASTLPLGATIGTAGLPVMPYQLKFRGTFFQISQFMAGVDGLIHARGDGLSVAGRLMTVDGFTFGPDPKEGFPMLIASLAITTYLTPSTEGLTVGASRQGPAPPAAAGSAATATPATIPAPGLGG